MNKQANFINRIEYDEFVHHLFGVKHWNFFRFKNA